MPPMFRRWLIRCCFMLPVILCVFGWICSGMHWHRIAYWHDGYEIGCTSESGAIDVTVGWAGDVKDGWETSSSSQDANFWPSDSYYSYFLGFGYASGRVWYPQTNWHGFAIPYWFLIFLFSAIFFLAWRKTRPAPNPKTAFPVEFEQRPL